MDDFIGVRGVISPDRLKGLSKRSDAKGLAQLASHYAAVTANTAALAASDTARGCFSPPYEHHVRLWQKMLVDTMS